MDLGRVRRSGGRDSGAALIESVLLLILLGLALIVVLSWVGDQGRELWEQVPQAFEPPPASSVARPEPIAPTSADLETAGPDALCTPTWEPLGIARPAELC